MSASAFAGDGPGASREASILDGAWAQADVATINIAATAADDSCDTMLSSRFESHV